MSEPILEVRHLSKSFGANVVLRDIDFTVSSGDVTTVIGPSGSGKSTLLRCVNLLDSYHISGVVKNYLMNRFSGNRAPLPTALRGLLAREGFTDEFLSLFEGEAET